MMILITYDVRTDSDSGQRRLRKVAKVCEKYGQRVQNSVFECVLDVSQFVFVKNELSQIINTNEDSLRFYSLGNNYKNQIVVMGKSSYFSQDETLIL